jgi:preprotein translocase subunit SecE
MAQIIGQVKRLQDFLRDVHGEMKKVSWPSRKNTVSSTVVVIVTVILVALFLGLIDLVLSKLMGELLKYKSLW